RNTVLPFLSTGFRRVHMHFAPTDASGLEMAYEIVDREILGEAAPEPAVKMSGSNVTTISADATNCIGEMDIRLEGDKNADKQQMLSRAMQIIEAKLFLSEKPRPLMLQLILVDHIGEDVNAV